MSSILIIGAGWLGRPLAQQLSADGHNVIVTNRSGDSVATSQELGLTAYPLSFPLPSTEPLTKLIKQHQIDTIIGCITPGFRQSSQPDWSSYAYHWSQITQSASLSDVDKVIMISSTAVYPSLMGDKYERDASLALAESSADFDNKSVAILNAEEQLKQHPFQYVILRCSGLVDAQRHPSRFVSHLKSISRLAPANMLHKSDAIGVIQFAIERLGNEIINVSTPNTVSKAEFYQQALIKTHPHLNSVEHLLPLITDTPDKRINSKKSERLGYRYHYQNTLDLL